MQCAALLLLAAQAAALPHNVPKPTTALVAESQSALTAAGPPPEKDFWGNKVDAATHGAATHGAATHAPATHAPASHTSTTAPETKAATAPETKKAAPETKKAATAPETKKAATAKKGDDSTPSKKAAPEKLKADVAPSKTEQQESTAPAKTEQQASSSAPAETEQQAATRTMSLEKFIGKTKEHKQAALENKLKNKSLPKKARHHLKESLKNLTRAYGHNADHCSDEYLDSTFKYVDKDGSGKANKTEIANVFGGTKFGETVMDVDSDQDGVLSVGEFKAAYRCFYCENSRNCPESITKARAEYEEDKDQCPDDETLANIFAHVDYDSNGKATSAELERAMIEHGQDKEEARKFMQAVDTDGDGMMSLEEFKAAVSCLCGVKQQCTPGMKEAMCPDDNMLSELFQAADTSEDKELTFDELEQALHENGMDDSPAEVLHALDTDPNGKVTEGEFKRGFKCFLCDMDAMCTSAQKRMKKDEAPCKSETDCKTYEGCNEPDFLACYDNICYTGTKSDKCTDKANGFDLGDGGFCWDERRDVQCKKEQLLVDPPNPAAPRRECFAHETATACRIRANAAPADAYVQCFGDAPATTAERVLMSELAAGDVVLDGEASATTVVVNLHRLMDEAAPRTAPLLTLHHAAGSVSVTPDHMLLIDGAFQPAHMAAIGSQLGEARVQAISYSHGAVINPLTATGKILAANVEGSPVLAGTGSDWDSVPQRLALSRSLSRALAAAAPATAQALVDTIIEPVLNAAVPRLPAFEWPLPSALMLLADVGLAAGFLLFALVSSPAALAIVGFASLRRKLHAKAL